MNNWLQKKRDSAQKSIKNCSKDDGWFEHFLYQFFALEPNFIVESPWDKKFPFADLVIYNLAKDRLNYDLILVESKNRKSLEHQEIDDFWKDLEMFSWTNILWIVCKTWDFPAGHFDSLYKAKHIILPFDKKTFEYFFEDTDSVIWLINTKLIEFLQLKQDFHTQLKKVAEQVGSKREL